MTDDEADPLEELVTEAEEQKEQFNEARTRLEEVRERLHTLVNELAEDDVLGAEEAEDIRTLIDAGEYGEARGAIEDARERAELAFDAEEKDVFAHQFEAAWSELRADVERIRTALVEFDDDLDREDLVDFLYGKYSNLNKGDIRATLDAFDQVRKTSLDTNQMARVLSAYDYDLQVRPTTEVLEAIEAEADR